MLEKYGDIFEQDSDVVVVTTNGFTKKNGECVMGKGIAKTVQDYYPEIATKLGSLIQSKGNVVHCLYDTTEQPGIVSFPIKPKTIVNNGSNCVSHCKTKVGTVTAGFLAKADIDLIKRSLEQLVELADKNPNWDRIICPRFGCGAGELSWGKIKPIAELVLDNRFIVMTYYTNMEVRNLNRYTYHPKNLKMCSKCFQVFSKSRSNFDIHKKRQDGNYNYSGKCKSCIREFRIAHNAKIKKDPEWYCKKIIAGIRHRAKKVKVPFNLDGDYLYSLWVKQEGLCYYSGGVIDLTATPIKTVAPHRDMASLDRKIPQLGYVRGNVCWTKYVVNRMKSDLTEEEFYDFCQKVTLKQLKTIESLL